VVHCVSEATAAHLRCAGFPGDHLRTIHVGLDLTPGTPERARDLRRDLGFADRDVVVGAVGRLVWVKGLETLLDAAARLAPRHPRLRCMIVGDGPLRAPLEARARRLGLDGRVVFTGHRTDVPDLLAAMDIHAAPSVTEGFPMATLEAMHAGLPSVVTDVGGYPEMVADGRTGFLVPPGSVGALAERIERLVDDADMRAAMGAAARDRARSRFDRATFLDRIETLLIEAAAAADAPGVQSLEPIGVGP
jgi:glycosyltransferase involved in cell wall biosynthesis